MVEFNAILEFELFKYKKFVLTPFDIILVVTIFFITAFILRAFNYFMNRSVKKREWMDGSTAYALKS